MNGVASATSSFGTQVRNPANFRASRSATPNVGTEAGIVTPSSTREKVMPPSAWAPLACVGLSRRGTGTLRLSMAMYWLRGRITASVM